MDFFMLKEFKNMSIRSKILTMVLAIVVIVMSLMAFIRINATVKSVEKEFNSKAETTTKLAALAFSNPLWNFDREGIARIGEALLQDQEVAVIILKTTEGEELYRKEIKTQSYGKKNLIVCELPVYNGQEKIGLVTVGLTNFYRQAMMNRDIISTLSGIFIAVLILWVLIQRSIISATRPLLELEEGTEDIARGNLSKRLKIESDDEIGRLAIKFNIMAENLSAMLKERDSILAALKVSEEKFAKAFQYSAEIIGIVDFESRRYLEINDIFVESFGYERNDIIGHTSSEVDLWVDEAEYMNLYLILEEEGAFKNVEMRWKTKEKRIQVGLCSGAIVTIGEKPCVIFVWHDITERKKAENELVETLNSLEIKVEERTQELNAMNQELRATNEELSDALEQLRRTQEHMVQSEKMVALGNLVAGVAHEINTPIGISVTAASYLDKLNKEFRDQYNANTMKRSMFEAYLDKGDETTHMIMLNLDRAAKLVNSFKLVSVDQSSEVRRVFGVAEYLQELISSLYPKLKKSSQTIRIVCDEAIQIDSYPGAFAQVITNFIMNSLLHAYEPDQKGEILINACLENQYLTVIYTDDGKGMEKDVLNRVFEPFFTTKRGTGGGTGLGLHIVYNLVVQQFGGTITCESELDKGTTFTVKIPLEHDA